MLTLEVEKRDTKIGPETVRKGGKVPAVFYGRKEEATPVLVDASAFGKIFKEAGESTIISLEGIGEEKEALIHDVDFHPVSGVVRHVDFYVIEKGKKLTVNVQLDFVGESPAVKDLGAVLTKVMHELEIEALPKNLPHEITVDISSLVDFQSHILVKDLVLSEGVEALAEADDVVVLVSEPKEEEEEEVTEIDMDSIEVAGEKKKDDDEVDEGEAPEDKK